MQLWNATPEIPSVLCDPKGGKKAGETESSTD